MERPGSELPVVYESPWRALGRDLRAVYASCVLALRRLWRRQWQGDLPTPPFWPRGQATLFWPALLLSALLLLGLAGGWAVRQLHSPSVERPVGLDRSGPSPSIASPTVPSPPLPIDPAFDPVQAPVETPPEPLPPKAKAAPSASSAPIQLPQGFSDDSGLVLAAPTGGSALLLNLRISEAFQALPERERQRLAQQWWQQALGLGYEQLRLFAPSGAELGRNAVVGGGMILLD
ncbi:hypothetical protein [Synechococcus sp. CBW1107]|uniref:hypothetical protein n=1 Tax=Synechococcus sp. CBW1107 TaxID=2789857 RepID=UPI002AD2B5AE|nr:hypothetical protein [Synechococcus sp. CBW1107]CAK6688403.1 hypothetical protein ICNINCKA_00399 [Synechococcus sp. CBW1107]